MGWQCSNLASIYKRGLLVCSWNPSWEKTLLCHQACWETTWACEVASYELDHHGVRPHQWCQGIVAEAGKQPLGSSNPTECCSNMSAVLQLQKGLQRANEQLSCSWGTWVLRVCGSPPSPVWGQEWSEAKREELRPPGRNALWGAILVWMVSWRCWRTRARCTCYIACCCCNGRYGHSSWLWRWLYGSDIAATTTWWITKLQIGWCSKHRCCCSTSTRSWCDRWVLPGRQLCAWSTTWLQALAVSWIVSWWEKRHFVCHQRQPGVHRDHSGLADSMGWTISWTLWWNYVFEELYERLFSGHLQRLWGALWTLVERWMGWKLLGGSWLLAWWRMGSTLGRCTTCTTWPTSCRRTSCRRSSTTRCYEGRTWSWKLGHASSALMGRSSKGHCSSSSRSWFRSTKQFWWCQMFHLQWQPLCQELSWPNASLCQVQGQGQVQLCSWVGEFRALLHEGKR